MQAWQELTKRALLGTEKLPLQLHILPEVIRQQVASVDATDRESQFLYAAALTNLYNRAGQKATLPPETAWSPSLATDEKQPFAPPQYFNLLKRLLDKNNLRADLLGLFLQKMVDKSYVLPHAVLVEFLNTVCKKNFENCHADAQKALGERGNWLAKQNVHWADFDLGKPDLDWEILTEKQVHAILINIRETEPKRAFDYIEKNWATSSSRQKVAFLQVLELNQQENELDFVQTIYDEILRGGDFKKKVNQEIRELAATLLLRFPKSELFKAAVLGLKKYVLTQKQLLGLSSKTVFSLPKTADEFLNSQNLVNKFGFSEIQTAVFDDLWLVYFFKKLHPIAWEMIFETTDWNKIFHLTDNTEEASYTAKNLYFDAIGEILNHVNYRPAVLSFMDNSNINSFNWNIFNCLTINELENFIFKKGVTLTGYYLAQMLAHQKLKRADWVWSRPFSLQVLRGQIFPIHEHSIHFLDLTVFFHPSVLDELYQESRKDWGADYQKSYRMRQTLFPMIQIMEFKKEIEALN